ncbi:hypothetical protein [Streptomyces sp. ODS28]|uniref:hypothetical protein n=1 Tax=Streptomyces sp. ODS28 TaxID=3136688 RepID=UPI0031E76A44
MGDQFLAGKLERLAASLEGLRGAGTSAVFVDRITQLQQVLDRMRYVSAGEVRIVALGANSSLKSTALRLLLGRTDDVLAVAPGAVRATAATELRLVQGDGTGGPPTVEATTLTEEGALRRARRLLDVEDDTSRTLTELSEMPHQNAPLVREMVESANLLDYGKRMPLEDLFARTRSITFSASPSCPLIARIRATVRVSPDVWPLDWAGGRSVVVVDTPGWRPGGALEDAVVAEMQSRAHIALLTVACSGGTEFGTPRTAPEPHCVFVATRLDAVDNPRDGNSLSALETSVAALLRDLHAHGRPGRDVRVAAVSGPWAAADESAWHAFDPKNPDLWASTQPAREAWREAAWDTYAATGDRLRSAVEGALEDGGVKRLRGLVEELAKKDAARVDSLELEQLIEDGQRLLGEVGAHVPATAQIELREQAARDDARPIAELRRIARDQADAAVYAADAWSEVRLALERNGTGGSTPSDVLEPLRRLDVAQLATQAFTGTRAELSHVLAQWWAAHTTEEFLAGSAQQQTDADHAEADSEAAAQIDAMAERLLHQLAGRPAADGLPRTATRLHFRQVARVREELARLMERRLIDKFESDVVLTQKALGELLVQQRLDLEKPAGPIAVLHQVRAELHGLSMARAGSVR